MTPRRRSRWPKSSRYSRRRRGRGRGGPGVGTVVFAVLLIAAGAWFIPRLNVGFRPRHPSATGVAPADAQALSDSVAAAIDRGAHVLAVEFAQREARQYPQRSASQVDLALAWHASVARPGAPDPSRRTAQRTSVETIEREIRALDAADSAQVMAQNDDEWLAAAEAHGRILEDLGLPVDALSVYMQMLQRRPDHALASDKVGWLREHLKNPLLPD